MTRDVGACPLERVLFRVRLAVSVSLGVNQEVVR
jgi:hypothetical protein